MLCECDSCHQNKELNCYDVFGTDFFYCDDCAKGLSVALEGLNLF